MIGIPIDLMPEFSTDDKMILLTEHAQKDPEIVEKIKLSTHSFRAFKIE